MVTVNIKQFTYFQILLIIFLVKLIIFGSFKNEKIAPVCLFYSTSQI